MGIDILQSPWYYVILVMAMLPAVVALIGALTIFLHFWSRK